MGFSLSSTWNIVFNVCVCDCIIHVRYWMEFLKSHESLILHAKIKTVVCWYWHSANTFYDVIRSHTDVTVTGTQKYLVLIVNSFFPRNTAVLSYTTGSGASLTSWQRSTRVAFDNNSWCVVADQMDFFKLLLASLMTIFFFQQSLDLLLALFLAHSLSKHQKAIKLINFHFNEFYR